MLIHLTPTLYADRKFKTFRLVDLHIASLNVHLRGGRDIVARRPLANKGYLVACKFTGNEAIDGILIDTPKTPEQFTLLVRWEVDGILVKHRVHYTVLDTEHDAVTEKMWMWNEFSAELGGWSSRHPQHMKYGSPLESQPKMELSESEVRRKDYVNDIFANGVLVERIEVFALPTIERERLLDPMHTNSRCPTLQHAIAA